MTQLPHSADLTLVDEHWRVVVSPAFGLLIREAVDVRTGAPMLWRQQARLAPPLSRQLPPPGPESIETFWDVFAGGWFPLFPAAGFTGELDGEKTLFHGELNRLPWQVVERGEDFVAARVETVRAPFTVDRRLALDGGTLRIETAVVNSGEAPASFTYGEHPCFPYETFAGGRLELAVERAWVPDPSYDPERAKLRPGEEFAWPVAPAHGGSLDLSTIPAEPDGRHDHACAVLGGPTIRIGAPRYGLTLEITVDPEKTPYILIWQDFGERHAFAVEPNSAPDRGVEQAVAAGAVTRLEPGDRFDVAVALRWV